MYEQIERVKHADVIINDHGFTSLLVEFRSGSTGQGWVVNPTPENMFKILVCFDASKLQDIVNKPIVVLRKHAAWDLISGIKRLPSDEPYEVIIE